MTVTLGEMPNERQAKAELMAQTPSKWRAASRPVAWPAGDDVGLRRKGRRGHRCRSDGPAAEQGFQTGNVILDVGGKAVANAGDVRKALNEAKAKASTPF